MARRIMWYVVLMVLSTGLSVAADLVSGKRAYAQRDYATALKEFTAAAEQGNAEAQLIVGKMYMLGQGTPKDLDRAIRWFKAAAAQGDLDAEFFLGAMYLLPRKDVSEGLKWLQIAAQRGSPDAQVLLGMTYLKGQDLPHDLVQADMWLQLAAAKGDKIAESQCAEAEKRMTTDQIARARALASAWKPQEAAKRQ